MALNCGVRPPITTKAGYNLLQNSSNNATNEPLVTTIFSPRSSYMLSGFCMVGRSMQEHTDQEGGASTRVYQYNYGGNSHVQKAGDDAEMNGEAPPFYKRNNSNDLQQLQVDDQGGMAEMVDEQGYNCVHPSEMKKRRLSNEQVKSLEVSFDMESKLEPDRKNQLAQELGLQPRQVAVWFQNRRARYKTKQLERDYDILKQQFDAVRSEKDKLQAEVARLKDMLDAQIACGKDALTPRNDQGQDGMERPHENQDDDLQNLSTSSGGAGKQKASCSTPCTTSGEQKAKLSQTAAGGADAFSSDNSNQTHAHVKVEATRKSPKLDVKPSLVAQPHLLQLQQQQQEPQFRGNLNPLSTSPQQQVLLHHTIAVKMEGNDHLHEPEYNLSYINEHHDHFHNIDHEEDDDDSILYFNRWHHDP